MALMGFILIATESTLAGLLPHIATGLTITEGAAGQFVSAYALGTVIATMPAVALTRGMRRKPVFIIGIVGFLVANSITAFSTGVVLSLATRFVAGAFSGLLWGLLAGYARRITPPDRAGRALAIASVGPPVGLAIGTPFGSWLGTNFGWRWSFGALSMLMVITLVLAVTVVPDAPGQRAASRVPLTRVFAIPGVVTVFIAIVLWGVAFGGAAAQLQTAISEASGNNADVANSTLGVAFNLAIFAAGVTGAMIIGAYGGQMLPFVMVVLALIGLVIALAGRRAAFPAGRSMTSAPHHLHPPPQ